jgi:hypothetical protein
MDGSLVCNGSLKHSTYPATFDDSFKRAWAQKVKIETAKKKFSISGIYRRDF